jgi:hypothetical protein
MTFKSCTCCNREYSVEEWERLPGTVTGAREHSLSPNTLDEYRNCPCGGTMVVDVVPVVLSLAFAS